MNPIHGMNPKDQPPPLRQPQHPPGSPGFAAAFQSAQTEWLYAVQATNPQRLPEKTKRKRVVQPASTERVPNETDALVSAILSTLSAIMDDEDEQEK